MDKIALGQKIGRAVVGIQNSRNCKVSFYRGFLDDGNNYNLQSNYRTEVGAISFEVQLQNAVLMVNAIIPVTRLAEMTDNEIVSECLKVG